MLVAQLQFRNRGADHRRRTLPPTDRLTTSSAQIFASLVFNLSYFYAIVADFNRSQDLALFNSLRSWAVAPAERPENGPLEGRLGRRKLSEMPHRQTRLA